MQQIQFKLLNQNADKQMVLFQNHLQRAGISELQQLEIVRVESKEGEMGAGKFVNALNAVVGNVKAALSEILKSSFSFSLKFRSDIFLFFNDIELTIQYNPQGETAENMKRLEEKLDKILALQTQQVTNISVVYGNGNIVMQDVSGNTIDIDTF
jgi:hypothetical protein